MTHRLAPALVAALVAVLALAAVAAADSPRLSRAGEAKFPHRTFLLSLPPGGVAEPEDVSVFENGEPVHGLAVTDASSAEEQNLGTVLVIDASNSMRGKPIEHAMSAARAFAEHRPASHKLGIVTFNRRTRTVLSPTTDEAQITAALVDPPVLAQRTRVRDGVMTGLDALAEGDVQVGSVIVLSDGADTGSRVSTGEVAKVAKKRGVRIFTVGLESGRFDPATLERLADASEGEYFAARSAGDLNAIYDELGAKLASEFLLSYSSVVGPQARVDVHAVVDGFPARATLTYTSPRLEAATAPPVAPRANGFWGSAVAMVVAAFGAAFLICFAAASILLAKRRSNTPEERVRAFVAMGEPEKTHAHEEREDRLYDRLEQSLREHAWWRRFCTDLEIAQIDRKPGQVAVMTGVGTLLAIWLFMTISGAAWPGLFGFLVPWGVRRFVGFRAAKQRVLFGEQLADNLQVIASAMRAGQSFAGALAVAVDEAPEPAKNEFRRVVADEQLGIPVENSLGVVVERMDNRDLHQVALVAALQRQAGGNSAEVLDRVADTIRDRVALRRLISTLTAQGRLSRWVVTLVPVALVAFISLTRPTYLEPLFHTTVGNVLLVLAVCMGFAGSQAIKRIVRIEV